MTKNRYLPLIFMIVVGFLLIVLGFFADSIGIGQGGRDFGPSQWIMIFVGIGMIIIVLLSRKFSFLIMMNLIILLLLLLLLDNALYWGSAWLPDNLIVKMTGDAGVKYEIATWKESTIIHDGNNYYRKPYIISESRRGVELVYDEFGYRNPPGYISQSKNLD